MRCVTGVVDERTPTIRIGDERFSPESTGQKELFLCVRMCVAKGKPYDVGRSITQHMRNLLNPKTDQRGEKTWNKFDGH